MLSHKEVSLATSKIVSNYLRAGSNYTLLSPGCNIEDFFGFRPVLSLSKDVKIIGGNGTSKNSYKVKLEK